MYHLAPEWVHISETFGNAESGKRLEMVVGAVPLLLKPTAVPSVRKTPSLRTLKEQERILWFSWLQYRFPKV